MNMDTDVGLSVLDSSCETSENPTTEELLSSSDHHQIHDQEVEPVLVWVPSGRRIMSGLLGLNVMVLGAALVAGQAFNPEGLTHQEPEVFLLVLMGVSLIWMLWYLLWARKQSGISPHKDHHAGGIPVILALVLFSAFSLLLFICRVGYLMSMKECKPAVTLLSPFIEALFLTVQTYLVWSHSKDCIHTHKITTRSGLMAILSTDLLLWLNVVTEDSIHMEIEMEKTNTTSSSEDDSLELIGNLTLCRCSASTACLAFRKGFEILYPFNIEYYLMAGGMIYVMWKNVGRRISPGHHHAAQKLTLRIFYRGGITFGLVFGGLVLVAGVTAFILYQVWVTQPDLRLTAFLIFYGYHVVVMPLMSLCCLIGILVYRLEARAHEGGHNPTRSLDVILLLAASLGQLVLSYFSLVAGLAMGNRDLLGDLDLSYSLLSLLEVVLQNIFIIDGLHRHPNLIRKEKQWSRNVKLKMKVAVPAQENKKPEISFLEIKTSASPTVEEHDGKKSWTRRATQEICAFLILSNIMLWVIPAFGVHPQFENSPGKQFFGFSAWLVMVNLGQPLGVFYRMHSVGALMELLISE
ncbi:proton channel OTOP3-like [Archocentrus centrarchus]|uniref:proton channel OTOP3-like n=1 Tax=Archocentrus centrarchus TaxID=63155 RepID=UPI0011E9C47F|nr:proton channel OTOP3-like [Archocentrus centrarchus]